MEKVLVDGSTLAAATRLLYWGARPTATNVFALSLLVESLILHDTIVALDTSDETNLASYSEHYNGCVAVHKQGVRSMVEQYAALEYPDFATMKDVLAATDRADRYYSDGIAFRAAGAVDKILLRKYRDDDEMSAYLQSLGHFYAFRVDTRTMYREARDLRNTAIGKKILRRDAPVKRPVRLKSYPRDMLLASGEMQKAGDEIINSYTGASGRSLWEEEKMWHYYNRRDFVPRLLIRTHFYLLASDVLRIPYRPDALRAPICWKFFSGGSFEQFGIDERFVDAAERVARDQVDSVNQFLKRDAFVLVPFFLARVLAEAASPGEIIPIVLEIRQSAAARRFRQYMAELRASDDAGDIANLAREISKYGGMLRRESEAHDGGGIEAALSLLTSGIDMALSPTPTNLVGYARDAVVGAMERRKRGTSWWYRRKTALISRTLRVSLANQSLPRQVERVFGSAMAPDELSFLRTVLSGSLGASENNT